MFERAGQVNASFAGVPSQFNAALPDGEQRHRAPNTAVPGEVGGTP